MFTWVEISKADPPWDNHNFQTFLPDTDSDVAHKITFLIWQGKALFYFAFIRPSVCMYVRVFRVRWAPISPRNTCYVKHFKRIPQQLSLIHLKKKENLVMKSLSESISNSSPFLSRAWIIMTNWEDFSPEVREGERQIDRTEQRDRERDKKEVSSYYYYKKKIIFGFSENKPCKKRHVLKKKEKKQRHG